MTITLNTKQIAILSRILDYVHETEKKSFEEYVAEGGNPDNHIYKAVVDFDKILIDNVE